eukprot:4163403-Prymnesium_polylepis.1
MPEAAATQQAAAVARARALAASLRELLVGGGGGDACGCVWLLLAELAAALHAESQRQAQEGAAAGPGRPSRAQKRGAQRKRVMRVLIGARHNVDTSAGGVGDEHNNVKSEPLVFWQGAPNSTAIGEQRAAGVAIFEENEAGAGHDEAGRAGVAEDDAESAGVRRQQLHEQQQQLEGQTAALAAAPEPSTAQMALMECDEQPASAEPR